MEFFIKKIFEGKTDESVHLQFQKFSRGEFKGRAMIRIKNSGGKFNIDTTAEYARELVKIIAEKLGNNKTHVAGALISALQLEGLSYDGVSSAIGVKKYQLDRDMSGKVGEDELKIQTKSPKSSKGASSAKKNDEKAKIDFCRLKTTDLNILKALIFDKEAENFKVMEVKHDFIITDIVIPPELKGEKDFEKVREGAHRKGKIIRYLDIDRKKIKKEIDFEA